MNARDWFRVVAKEVRALAPAWIVCAVPLIGAKAPSSEFQTTLQILSVTAYFLGPSALGALSIGHEYNYRTLPLLLTQPVGRSRIFLAKSGVLFTALLLFAVIGSQLEVVGDGGEFGRYTVWMPIALGAFVAPWLTMLARRPLGGAVFAIAIPGILLVIGVVTATQIYGFGDGRNIDFFRIAFVWSGVLVSSAAGAILGWRTFRRLDAAEPRTGGESGRGMPQRAETAAARRTRVRHPLGALLVKELRLQQLSLAIAGGYIVVFLVAVFAGRQWSHPSDVLTILSVFYCALVAALTGSCASAEERHLGTLDSQLLLPIAAWRQWLVKVAVVLGVTLLLGDMLPVVAAELAPGSALSSEMKRELLHGQFAVITVLLAAGGLYVSTLSTNGLWALVISIPVVFAVGVFTLWIAPHAMAAGYSMLTSKTAGGFFSFRATLADVVAAVFFMLVAYLAFTNHRTSDRTVMRVVIHAAFVAAFITLAFFGLGGLMVYR